ncbi:phage tail spike protein [Glutamicibacter sp. BW80]|uniref:phage tail spike protein n=1 Tax=Glutamicibacter sp. BW80 TaxID=2024404 RepID=UPI001142D5A4|nr:phage tail spike protein [Glutamicibacter sp. BW80]
MWDNRFSWSGEVPTSYPDLNPVALQRIEPASGLDYADAVTPSRMWQRVVGGANDGYVAGQWGYQMGLNQVNPATDQGGFKLPYFSGLWPSSGKLLMGLWTRQSYVMAHSPLMSTRGGSSPVAYLATAASGRLRHQVYSSTGASLLDQYEDTPWVQTLGWQFVGQLLDYGAQTSQLFSVLADTGASWIGPVRALAGAPNPASTADLDVYALQSAGYWTTGVFDEALVAHPGASFDLPGFVDSVALGKWADGQKDANRTRYTLSESSITAQVAGTLSTGAERVSWSAQPVVTGAPAEVTPYWSTDAGATWQTGSQLPAALNGLLRWTVPMTVGQSFSGFTVDVPSEPAPTLEAIPNQTLEQGGLVNIPLVFSNQGAPSWSISTPPVASATISGSVLTLASGFEVGDGQVTVTLTDEIGRKVSRTFTVTVTAREWEAGAPPNYPHAPIILYDGDDVPVTVIIDSLGAVVTSEVNGEHKFEFTLPATHKYASTLTSERFVEVAGERYRIRRITDARSGRKVHTSVYAEAEFYDLATAGQIDAQEFRQVAAGDVMTIALAGTGWSVDVANVRTLRTYSIENTNPLALLREVQKNHGGDLVFDNRNHRVSLVTNSGRDNGVAFFYGKGLSDPKRVIDTTSLITRIYARNADGQTIASVNNGVPYVEDYSHTSEVRSATYDFKSGTSPYTMLAMANATLANRSKPSYSYEVTVADTGNELDAFDAGDFVTVVDEEIGISDTQRIVRLEYDIIKPWRSGITLSAKLRELGSSESTDAGLLTTGTGQGAFDLVPFNLLLNARFDNGLAHWASFGAEVVDGEGTGDQAVMFSGPGERWIEQTVTPDNRESYAFSFDVRSTGPTGFVPDIGVEAVVTYEDGTSETIQIEIS